MCLAEASIATKRRKRSKTENVGEGKLVVLVLNLCNSSNELSTLLSSTQMTGAVSIYFAHSTCLRSFPLRSFRTFRTQHKLQYHRPCCRCSKSERKTTPRREHSNPALEPIPLSVICVLLGCVRDKTFCDVCSGPTTLNLYDDSGFRAEAKSLFFMKSGWR